MEPLKVVAGIETDLQVVMAALGREARAAARTLALSSDETRSQALRVAASAVRERMGEILAANARDVAEARQRGTAPAFVDRLVLDEGTPRGRRARPGHHRRAARSGRAYPGDVQAA